MAAASSSLGGVLAVSSMRRATSDTSSPPSRIARVTGSRRTSATASLADRRPGLSVSVGTHENDARLAQRGEEPQEQQRRRVGGVQIIEYENDGLRVAGCSQEGGG